MRGRIKSPMIAGCRLQACSLQLAAACIVLSLMLVSPSFAKEITILFTGQTHAMLYDCGCPHEPDGGLRRRATLVKQLRDANPDMLLVDSGGFFAGGLLDEYTQNTELDKTRTEITLKAMKLMGYDALAIGDSEFNFGVDFLREEINRDNLSFVSANVRIDKVSPFMIKDIAGVRIGIIGLTNPSAKQKAGTISFADTAEALRGALSAARKSGAELILLLANLGEEEDVRLINQVQGIDIAVIGYSANMSEPDAKVGSTLVLRPSWQGRRLGKLVFSVENKKIKEYKVEQLRLSEKIADDSEVAGIMPECFSDRNCKKKGFLGICQQGGTVEAACQFSKPVRVDLTVINARECRVCGTEKMIGYLRQLFPGLAVTHLTHPDAKAKKLIKDLDIKGLPAYLLGKNTEKAENYAAIKDNIEERNNYLVIKPILSGIGYFLGRKEYKGQVDLFISLFDQDSPQVLEAIKEYNPRVHFLAIEQEGQFDAKNGVSEVEECLRSVCVQKYYPNEFWGYLSCRARNISSSWWEECIGRPDAAPVSVCAKGEEGKMLLRENIRSNKELNILLGPAYLLDNQQIFGSRGAPRKEELDVIIKGETKR